jgi:hypothetical protein
VKNAGIAAWDPRDSHKEHIKIAAENRRITAAKKIPNGH